MAFGTKAALHDLRRQKEKEAAMQFFLDNRVPAELERLLNDTARERPEDVFGYLSERLGELSRPPSIARLVAHEVYDSSFDRALAVRLYCTVKGREKARSTLHWYLPRTHAQTHRLPGHAVHSASCCACVLACWWSGAHGVLLTCLQLVSEGSAPLVGIPAAVEESSPGGPAEVPEGRGQADDDQGQIQHGLDQVQCVSDTIGPLLEGFSPLQQGLIDGKLMQCCRGQGRIATGTSLAVSMACARAGEAHGSLPLPHYLAQVLKEEVCLLVWIRFIKSAVCNLSCISLVPALSPQCPLSGLPSAVLRTGQAEAAALQCDPSPRGDLPRASGAPHEVPPCPQGEAWGACQYHATSDSQCACVLPLLVIWISPWVRWLHSLGTALHWIGPSKP